MKMETLHSILHAKKGDLAVDVYLIKIGCNTTTAYLIQLYI